MCYGLDSIDPSVHFSEMFREEIVVSCLLIVVECESVGQLLDLDDVLRFIEAHQLGFLTFIDCNLPQEVTRIVLRVECEVVDRIQTEHWGYVTLVDARWIILISIDGYWTDHEEPTFLRHSQFR